MKPQKFRWSKVYESSEEELVAFLRARDITADHWEAGAFGHSTHTAGRALTIWCAEGSLSLMIEGVATSLQPGDAVHLPAGTAYDLSAGMSGYICYESAR